MSRRDITRELSVIRSHPEHSYSFYRFGLIFNVRAIVDPKVRRQLPSSSNQYQIDRLYVKWYRGISPEYLKETKKFHRNFSGAPKRFKKTVQPMKMGILRLREGKRTTLRTRSTLLSKLASPRDPYPTVIKGL